MSDTTIGIEGITFHVNRVHDMGRRREADTAVDTAVDDVSELVSGETPSVVEELEPPTPPGPRDSRFEVRRAVSSIERALKKLDSDEQAKALKVIATLYE